MAGMVGELCGVQAQVITAAEMAIGARVERVTQQDVRRELWEKRTLVKTYGPRGTLHLLPADELPAWMAAMRARADLRGGNEYEGYDIEPAQAEALLEGIGEALDGECLTREELALRVSSRVGSWAKAKLESTWGVLLGPAAYRGLLCFGPSQGSKVTFARADQWIGGWKEVEPAGALKEVARRYLATYGPATYREFARWFWLPPDDARRVIESLGGEVEEVKWEGRSAWVLAKYADAGDSGTNGQEEASVRLLPQYDTYVLANGPRDRIVPGPAHKRIFSYGRGRYEGAVALPILLIDGVVAGMWERKMRAKAVDIRVEAFKELSKREREMIEAEAQRIGEFFGIDANLTFGSLN
jgi:hypothetical protein